MGLLAYPGGISKGIIVLLHAATNAPSRHCSTAQRGNDTVGRWQCAQPFRRSMRVLAQGGWQAGEGGRCGPAGERMGGGGSASGGGPTGG
jgi:hypothetical protein